MDVIGNLIPQFNKNLSIGDRISGNIGFSWLEYPSKTLPWVSFLQAGQRAFVSGCTGSVDKVPTGGSLKLVRKGQKTFV